MDGFLDQLAFRAETLEEAGEDLFETLVGLRLRG
jgi:hypothetical protein